jgi:6-pyruvoyltetrahydropterin/6-carboxytetrahydropterin synthase
VQGGPACADEADAAGRAALADGRHGDGCRSVAHAIVEAFADRRGEDLWRVAVADHDFTEVRTAVAEQTAVTSSPTVLVSRRESFNAAHQLRDPRLSDAENRRLYGKCANLHGHNYVLEVVVAGQIDHATGYLMDLKELSRLIARRIIEDVDHRNLNTDVPWLQGVIPTAENLAVAFWQRLRSDLPAGSLRSVRLWETDKNWAEVGERV